MLSLGSSQSFLLSGFLLACCISENSPWFPLFLAAKHPSQEVASYARMSDLFWAMCLPEKRLNEVMSLFIVRST